MLFRSQLGKKALNRAISMTCKDVIAVPQVQLYLDSIWVGTEEQIDVLRGTKDVALDALSFILRLLLLPIVAVYPPLADHPKLYYSPRLRYFFYDLFAVVFFVLIATVELNMYRDEPLFARDWGLLLWSLMLLAAQFQFILLDGVTAFFVDSDNFIDLIGNMAAMTGLMLDVCHGRNSQLSWVSNCNDWPGLVPLAGWEVMSIAVLIHGLQCKRLLKLNPKFGPLLLSVGKMSGDLGNWILLTSFPIMAFAGALRALYGEGHKDPSVVQSASCSDPDTDFESFGHGSAEYKDVESKDGGGV